MRKKLLCQLDVGETAIITELNASGSIRRRLQDLGFVPGNRVTCIGVSPLGDPKSFRISNTIIALREEDSGQLLGELDLN